MTELIKNEKIQKKVKKVLNWTFGIIGSLFLLIIILAICIPSDSSTTKNGYKIKELDACYMSHQFVEPYLVSPGTAKFQNCYDAKVNYQGNQIYYVHSYVDSQNSYGAMLRTQYSVELFHNTNTDRWTLRDIQFY